jgi:putative membrane protein
VARNFLLGILERENQRWFQLLFRWQGSVLPGVLPRAFFCAGFALFIAALHERGWRVSWPVLGTLVPSIVLGLLLVFRTNTAYERYWEGRKLWGHTVNTTRNLARSIWVTIKEEDERDRAAKIQSLYWLVAFSMAMKLHLRGEPLDAEFAEMVTPEEFNKLQGMNNPPLEVAFWIADYLQKCHDHGQLNTYQLAAMVVKIDYLVDALGGCERILKTPIPLAYTIHLQQLLFLYCLALPFQVVESLTWWTALVVLLISFAVFGIEEIGIEIENPFGHDPNDLPLDTICRTMRRNIEDLTTLSPYTRRWEEKRAMLPKG